MSIHPYIYLFVNLSNYRIRISVKRISRVWVILLHCSPKFMIIHLSINCERHPFSPLSSTCGQMLESWPILVAKRDCGDFICISFFFKLLLLLTFLHIWLLTAYLLLWIICSFWLFFCWGVCPVCFICKKILQMSSLLWGLSLEPVKCALKLTGLPSTGI